MGAVKISWSCKDLKDPLWAELVSLIVVFSILFCFAERMEVFPHDF